MNKKQIGMAIGIIAGVVLLLAGILLGVKKRAVHRDGAKVKNALHQLPHAVSLEQVKSEQAKRVQKYPGVVKSSDESALSFRVGGPLVVVNFVLGQSVAKGTLLMQIDQRDFKDRINSLEAQLKGAKAMLLNAQQDYDRSLRLFGEKVISQADYDRAGGAKAVAEAAVDNLDVQLQIARHSLKDSSVLAPYDGIVSAQLVQNYEMVRPGQVVLMFHNIQQLEVTINVPENEIIKYDMSGERVVQLSFPAIPEREFKAHLKEWSSIADNVTRTYAVTFEFDAPEDMKILPGMSVEVSWFSASAEEQLTLPFTAIVPDVSGKSNIWVYDEATRKAKRRVVQLGGLIGTSRVVLLSGATEGEQVVVLGSRLINDGLILKPVSANEYNSK